MIWAAAYAAFYINGGHGRVTEGIEWAWGAVMDGRSARQGVIDGWGEDDSNYQFYCEMFGDGN